VLERQRTLGTFGSITCRVVQCYSAKNYLAGKVVSAERKPPYPQLHFGRGNLFGANAILYHQLSPALQALVLNPEGIQYYAHSVIKSEIFKSRAGTIPTAISHVIAFIAYQYFPAPGQPC
jgi:hypothetical protein